MEPGHRGTAVRAARLHAGLTQVQLARRTGVAQPNIAAYELGRRPVSDELMRRLLGGMRPRPSAVLRLHADQVKAIARAHGAMSVRVFGSIARGEDGPDSDVDLLVRLRSGTSLMDLVAMTRDLEELLGCTVDVVSDGGLKGRDGHIREESVLV